jgi:hypothetical protein
MCLTPKNPPQAAVKGKQDNTDLWRKIRNTDEQVSHLVSARIVQFAKQHEASILVFEHLGNLKPASRTPAECHRITGRSRNVP